MGSIDLHMHSDISLDGEFTPEILAGMCLRRGLKAVSLTDHNSVRGAAAMSKALSGTGVRFINGIELDCTVEGVDLHLLGYDIDITDSRYLELEESILEQKREYSRFRIDKMKEMGFLFEEEKVYGLSVQGIVIPEMLAEVILKDARNVSHPLLKPFRPGGKRGDNPYVNFFWDFFSQGRAAYAPVHYMGVEEAVRLIEDTGGFSVIAHPGPVFGRREELIQQIAGLGAVGLETCSSYHSDEERVYYNSLADRYSLWKTMGSDFHGKSKPSVKLGETGAGKEQEQLFWDRYESR